MEFIQNIVYAPGSVKVVYKGSEKTAIVGKFSLTGVDYSIGVVYSGANLQNEHVKTLIVFLVDIRLMPFISAV